MPAGEWRRAWAVVPGAGAALLPKLACPLCWPAYAAALSAVGLGFLLETRYLLPLTAGFLLVALGALGWGARRRRGFGPFWLGMVAAVVALAGTFWLAVRPVTYAGVTLLLVASIWNAVPRRATGATSCPECAVPGAGSAPGDE